MKSRKVKWYSPSLMRRAARAQQVFDYGLLILTLQEGRLHFVAFAKRFATTRDGYAVDKETARLTAGLPQLRMTSIAGIRREDVDSVIEQMNGHIEAMSQSMPGRTLRLGRGGIPYV